MADTQGDVLADSFRRLGLPFISGGHQPQAGLPGFAGMPGVPLPAPAGLPMSAARRAELLGRTDVGRKILASEAAPASPAPSAPAAPAKS
jgi:hypothetical protein